MSNNHSSATFTLTTVFLYIAVWALVAHVALARGGGGGSGSGEEVYGIFLLPLLIYAWYLRRKRIKEANEDIAKAHALDPTWKKEVLIEYASGVFLRFQDDWCAFRVDSMRTYCTERFVEKIDLQLSVLRAMGRKNVMKDVRIRAITIIDVQDHIEDHHDRFVVEIRARAIDQLYDVATETILLEDKSGFTEFWAFVRKGDTWLLEHISQATLSMRMVENAISAFASRNNLHYDPDFGWLMLPTKGVLFGASNPKKSDVNNHVIGKIGEYTVQLFTFVPSKKKKTEYYKYNYLVTQIVLPVHYDNILLRKKHWLINTPPKGLRRIRTESNAFENKFCLYATPSDQINSFVLFAPDFIERVYQLPFDINIEVVDNFLYFYTKKRKGVDYDRMFALLTDACRSLRSN